MKTWIRARIEIPCGSCTTTIQVGAVMLELEIGKTKRARCAACATRMFNEDPPDDIPDDTFAVPQPSLPMGGNFIATRALARYGRSVVDYRRRASGDRE